MSSNAVLACVDQPKVLRYRNREPNPVGADFIILKKAQFSMHMLHYIRKLTALTESLAPRRIARRSVADTF